MIWSVETRPSRPEEKRGDGWVGQKLLHIVRYLHRCDLLGLRSLLVKVWVEKISRPHQNLSALDSPDNPFYPSISHPILKTDVGAD